MKRHQMRTEDIIKGLWNLGRTSTQNGENQVEEAKIIEVLDALFASGDLALIELIPILLSLFFQSGFSVNLTPLFDRYGIDSQQSETIQKFLLITLSLLKEENLPLPAGSIDQETLLKKRWGDLVSSHVLELGNGISLQINRLREVFRQFAGQPPEAQPVRIEEEQGAVTPPPPQIHRHLRLLFSAKQEELILKKLNGEPLTKTEREYYSRVVKKKLKALADKNLQELASRLTEP
ncbi:MAG: hypothetical protein R6X27_08975, partial [Candidatus Desulfacyla sp.]